MIRALAVLVLVLVLGLVAALVLWQVLQDAGYVLVVWQGWQMQTSVVVWIMLVLAFALLSVLLLFAISTLTSLPLRLRRLWKARQNRRLLHHAEQLAGFWLLDQPAQGLPDLRVLQQNRPKQPVWTLLLARTLQADDPGQAQRLLAQVPTRADDLVLLLQLEQLLGQRDVASAASVLELLLRQPHQGMAQTLQPAYGQALTRCWCDFARLAPWWAVTLPEPPARLTALQWQGWLAALRAQAPPDSAHMHRLLWRLDQQEPALLQQLAADWLTLLVELPEGQARAWLLGRQVLEQRFDPLVLRKWSQLLQPFAQPLGQLPVAAQLLQDLDGRYPGQPLIQLALLHVDLLEGQAARAHERAALWPDGWLSRQQHWLSQAIDRTEFTGALADFVYTTPGEKSR